MTNASKCESKVNGIACLNCRMMDAVNAALEPGEAQVSAQLVLEALAEVVGTIMASKVGEPIQRDAFRGVVAIIAAKASIPFMVMEVQGVDPTMPATSYTKQ